MRRPLVSKSLLLPAEEGMGPSQGQARMSAHGWGQVQTGGGETGSDTAPGQQGHGDGNELGCQPVGQTLIW